MNVFEAGRLCRKPSNPLFALCAFSSYFE